MSRVDPSRTARLRRRHGWVLVPLGIFAIARLVSGVLLHRSAVQQAEIARDAAAMPAGTYDLVTPVPDPVGYLGVIANWDGGWYRTIAEHGYPVPLPRLDGQVVPNEWAFSPGYPFVVRAVMEVASIGFPLAATIVSLLCGAAAITWLYAMVRTRMGDPAAARLVMAVSFFPSAPILQVAYAEGMALLLIVGSLWALAHRRHGWLVGFAALLAVTRPLVLPLALLSGIVWLTRWHRRRDVDFPTRERWTCAAATVACAALAGAWPGIAALVTGEPTAFTDTMAAWPGNEVWGGATTNWLTLSVRYPLALGSFVFVVLALAVFAATRKPARSLPVALRWWGPSYLLYLMVATKPSMGIVRYLLLAIFPLSPLLEPSTPATSRAGAAARWVLPVLLAVAGVVGQYYWITYVFMVDGTSSFQAFP
ncbi:hypothetical protein J2X46_002769 [Nocardioides sp. BE266]|uniref:hypothetical protein n=1 Tax=Nocardioides sp. BE266 TaxID=2817725 RepID=UPI00286120A4|nr:hypothetical protein [Nocardioides sp. BE266]MDR7253779.1 hypothetical protein [Nocardioides sp. BE266]